jgi:hypothetical protein
MTVYLLVSVASGIAFGILDAAINANPLAQRLYQVYKPIARTRINPLVGMAIDLGYGFAMGGVFLILYASLPGGTGLLKGVAFGLLVWFFRVAMAAASQGMMFRVPAKTLLYSLVAGLGEMLILGVLYGLTLRPAA